MCPVDVSTPSTNMFTRLPVLMNIDVARRLKRSASTPKIGPNTTAGANCVNATMPTHSSEPESSQANQPSATRYTHRPCSEIVLPMR